MKLPGLPYACAGSRKRVACVPLTLAQRMTVRCSCQSGCPSKAIYTMVFIASHTLFEPGGKSTLS
jgi:hypothetical protein